MFGVVYAAIELSSGDNQTQAIVIGHSDRSAGVRADGTQLRTYCVAYNLLGTTGESCEKTLRNDPPDCYLDAEIGKRLPNSCQFSD